MDDMEVQTDSGPFAGAPLVTADQASTATNKAVLLIHNRDTTAKRGFEEGDKGEGQRNNKKKRLVKYSEKTHINHSRRMHRMDLKQKSLWKTPDQSSDQYRPAELYLPAHEYQFRLPPLSPDLPETNSRTRTEQLPITSESLAAALGAPIAGLILPTSGLLDIDTLNELARAIRVAPGIIRTKPSEPPVQSEIITILKAYLHTTLANLLRYCKQNPDERDSIDDGHEGLKHAAAYLDEKLAQKWLKAQPARLLEEKVIELLHAQGCELDAKASRYLELAIEPVRIWPDLHPDIYAYMNRYRQLAGVLVINPITLMKVIDQFVAARTAYLANINDKSSKSAPRSPGQKSKSNSMEKSYSQSTETYRDTNNGGRADDSSDDEPVGGISWDADADDEMGQIGGSEIQKGDAPFLKVLDKWIWHRKSKEQKKSEKELELKTAKKVSDLTLGDRPPMKKGLRMMLEARGIKPRQRDQNGAIVCGSALR